MNCCIFRSEKKQGAYLYLVTEKVFQDIPEELQALLGHCVEVMQLDLSNHAKLATQDIELVKVNLREFGYHLQMPPKDSIGVINFGV